MLKFLLSWVIGFRRLSPEWYIIPTLMIFVDKYETYDLDIPENKYGETYTVDFSILFLKWAVYIRYETPYL